MKKGSIAVLFFLWAVSASLSVAVANPLCNPKPSEGDLIIPGPQGTCFAFRAIEVEAATPMHGEIFYMGDAESEDFRTPVTKVMVGGTFASEEDENQWFYYLGKYEITRGQYRAVMGALPVSLKDTEANAEKDSLPVTNVSYFEAIQFMDKLNQWFYANALDAMPTAGRFPGFVRFPSEAEWEFAARGGKKVDKTLFEAATVYGDKLGAHEWFGGHKSSHGKIKKIGLLSPNPVGIHDMLGNVQEMTLSQYQVRYYEGRSGGFASRGGSYIMDGDKLRSAQRQEEPFYLVRGGNKITPNTKPTLGFRLAISAPLLTDKSAIEELEDAYEEYMEGQNQSETKQGARQLSPAELSVAPISDQAGASVYDALVRVQKLRQASPEDAVKILNQELAYAENALRKTVEIRNQADADNALGWLRQTHFLSQELRKVLQNRQYTEARIEKLEGQKSQEGWKKRLAVQIFSIERFSERYGEGIEELSNLPVKIVEEAFVKRKKDIEKDIEKGMTRKEVDLALQLLGILQGHYKEYFKTKRADTEKWRLHFEQTLEANNL